MTSRASFVLLVLSGCGNSDGNLTKVNYAPVVSLQSPVEGALLQEATPITFIASVTDDHDAIEDLVYSWTKSDGTALIGTQEPLADEVRFTVTDGLTDGEYIVNLEVTDVDFQVGADSVGFAVVDNSPPTVEFVEPTTGAVYGDVDTIDVDIVVADGEEDDLNTLALTWSGDLLSGAPATPTSDGHARYTLQPQAPGTYTIGVTVADSLGSTAYAEVDLTVVDVDLDGDGYPAVAYGGDDCDDEDATVHPGMDELCDGVDQDCDGSIDEDALDALTWYADADADGAGDAGAPVEACEARSGTVGTATDCDDTDDAEHPGADELCDGDDDDCDGAIDEEDATDAPAWYTDADGDGFGDTATETYACTGPGGTVAEGGDCDDADADRSPGAAEVCNDLDDDCNTVTDDDATDAPTWYPDVDADGYGDDTGGTLSCAAIDAYVLTGGDCDDVRADVSPEGLESCNGVDDDCDGATDDEDSLVSDPLTWYEDADGDGAGAATSTVAGCEVPPGYGEDASDCDDSDADIHPGAAERCATSWDDNCDGDTNDPDASGCTEWFADADADGFGDGDPACLCDADVDHVVDNADDCDDADGAVNPDAADVCENDADENCDGSDMRCPVSGVLSASTADLKLTGNSANLLLGQELCFVPDGDGDGDDEIAAASVYASSSAGAVWLLPGVTTGSTSVSYASTWITGAATGDNFGFAMDAGDLDGDGLGDLAVASHLADEGGAESGVVWLYRGGLRAGIWSADAYDDGGWYGGSVSDYFGVSVAVVPDATGDGAGELAVGALYQDSGGSNAGAVYVDFGPVGSGGVHAVASGMDAMIVGEDTNDYLGATVAAGGDFDGDGLEDLLLSAYGDDTIASSAGAIYVASDVGSLTGTVDASALAWKFGGDTSNDTWGYSTSGHPLSTAGDLDDDGYDDFVVGSPADDDAATNAGAVYVVLGRGTASGSYPMTTAGSKLLGSAASDDFGYSVSGGGDIDADGYDDFVVGVHLNDQTASSAGAALIFYGSATGASTTADADIRGESASDELGYRVRMGGDANGDGFADVLLGATNDDDGAANSGAAYLFRGASR